ncbi:homeobox protein PKNOX2-like [Daphnia carinata]|uniref:homeobox protein PKNOX2-like n=1 Tax=Daphnia carinata TaxID=120202 RepID=UPI00257B1DC5|nr:homeobox protein PKNOX2-like [Daphnia carinata]
MERVDVLLSGAQQQHQYFNSSDHVSAAHKGMDVEYHAIAGVNVQDRVQFEADKQAVYRHPLFPLLALLLEKCEEATRGEVDTRVVLQGLENDVRAFVQHERDGNKTLMTDNAEVDGLMLKALQVLRIHLLELEKVQELCRDFCRRYIACLRGKLHSENLLRTEGENGGLDGDEAGYDSNCSNGSGSHPFNLDAVASSYSSQYRRIESTNQPSSRPSQVSYVQSSLSSDEEDENVGGNPNPSTKVKRGVLPRKATAVLRSWLFQHLVHPYPTEEEKRQLATQTKLTLLQVNNWFINARRRILQPMLDSAHATHNGPASLQPDVDFAPKRTLLSGTGSSSGPGSDGEDALSYGDSDQ